MNSPEMRAGDADRDQVIARLRDAFAEGRLTQSEFDDRMNQAHQAKTIGDLAPLTADLPTSPPAHINTPTEMERSRKSRDLRAAWGAWVGVGVLMIVIWFATGLTSGSFGFFWPIWVIGPWGAAMLIAQLTGAADKDR
jgi:hypothetical protein